MVSHGEGGLVSLMKRSWVKKIQAPTTSPNTAVCLCGCRCWNRPLEALTLALFTLAEAFKHTTHRQCQQLYLCLHVDGVLFPVSLQDVVVGSTSLPRSICIHSTHGSAEIWEREANRERERGHLKENIAWLKLQVMERLEERTANERKERNENVAGGEREKWMNERNVVHPRSSRTASTLKICPDRRGGWERDGKRQWTF